jgi:indolepyruvate ferredoxin oxidoreductase beta subunit
MIVRCQEFTERTRTGDLSAPKTVSLVGMGGQGVSLAADILNEAAQLAGFDAALLEIYSIGRCGGNVRCQVTLAPAEATSETRLEAEGIDYLVAFEMKSGLDLLSELEPDGSAILHRMWLDSKGHSDPATAARWSQTDERISWLEEFQVEEPGDEKALPAYVLGALSRRLPIGDGAWREAIAHHVPAKLFVEAMEMFEEGASTSEPAAS